MVARGTLFSSVNKLSKSNPAPVVWRAYARRWQVLFVASLICFG
jgi:hypothetical protein